MIANKRTKGIDGESLAVVFLQQKGFAIVERNFRFGHGEIDIIAREGSVLVFVEVKTRHSSKFGSPEESVTDAKQHQLRQAAEGYLHSKELEEQRCRFDVISISYQGERPEIRHIENAF